MPETRYCTHCGGPFLCARAARQRYCSPAHAYADRKKPIAERFWPKVDRDGPMPPHRPELGPCWLWRGARGGKGYGLLGDGTHRGTPLGAHRVSYELHFGAISAGLDVCHHCDTPACVRPDHLFTETRTGNMQDAKRKGRLVNGAVLHPARVSRGENRYNARLTPEDVKAIRGRYAAGGTTYGHIAADYPVSEDVIGQIVRRKRWKHIP